ncbi:MAG: mandelate racemase/muconate lactonizing enzyme family protein [Sphaerochaeta sp.]|jgi:L-alanine-DL-glutamate epimerase-like enolase superfamily enzyme|uniref:mandelate racemase/muconate lactonizing enzyme family protein n=1 Tax=Sphaerochaeta sp. TaxID=1972642 RepID=UPI003D0D2F2B
MKIERIETILMSYRYSQSEAWKWSGGATLQRNCVLVRITTDTGLTGLGEVGESAYLPRSIEKIVQERFEPMLVGEDPMDIEKIWQKLYIQSCHYARKGVVSTIMSGVDIALYDIVGKYLKVPVSTLLGGQYRKKIRAYASGGMYKDEEDLFSEAASYVDSGYFGFKMRIGAQDPMPEVEMIRRLHARIGNRIQLLVDAGQCYTNFPWSYTTALKVCKALEDCNLFWMEEPLHPDDVEGFVRLSRATTVPIVAGENEFTRYGFAPLISRRGVSMVQPDVTRSGGISECKKIASYASVHHMDCAPHIFGSGVGFMANLHFIVSTPNAIVVEHDQTLNPLRESPLLCSIEYKDGYIHMPEGLVGLGVELSEDVIRAYPYIDEDAVRKPDFIPLW